ncbi:MAG: hypothetical protein JRD68_12335 [Deltaproteobacteria bacterium]|nr:hypothetical protein [Deltaproteobacteria bacterium]
MAIRDSKLRELRGLLDNLPLSKWGFADTSGLHPLAEEFPKALSLALSYEPDFDLYDEQRFHVLLHDKRDELNGILNAVSEFLRQAHIPHFVSPDTGQDNTMHCFMAFGARIEHTPNMDETENIESEFIEVQELLDLIDQGQFFHALHVSTIFLALRQRRIQAW